MPVAHSNGFNMSEAVAFKNLTLQGLAEDLLICIVSFLEPPEILRLSQTCKRLQQLATLRIVWTNACTRHIIARGYPFTSIPVNDIPTDKLISCVKHSYRLAQRWISGIRSPSLMRCIEGTSGTSVSEIRFMPGKENRFLATISKSVWSILSIWDIGEGGTSGKVCEWSPRGAIFTGFAVNGDPKSKAKMAVSLQLNEQHFVKILSLLYDTDSGWCSITEIYSIDTKMTPKTLSGDFIALADDTSQTALWNWRNCTYAILEHIIDDRAVIHSNDCNQVFFAPESLLIARARSIYLFPFPDLKPYDQNDDAPIPYRPIAQHSFGWVDGQSLTICPFLKNTTYALNSTSCQPLSILVRGESDDPWASDIHNLELYTLDPNPSYSLVLHTTSAEERPECAPSPYLFPPRLSSKVACLRGSLRCKQVVLGRFGTALWIQPRDRFIGGLLADIPSYLVPTSTSHETLVMAVFPGSLNRGESDLELWKADGEVSTVVGKKIFGNESTTAWTSFDYDEVGGRVALGSSFGRVTILEL